MKITIDYNNDEIRVEGLGPTATFQVVDKMGTYEALLLELFNRLGVETILDVTLLTENEDKRKVLGEW